MVDDADSRAAIRQTLTVTTLVEIVDTLVGEFDIIEVLTSLTSRCLELLDAAAAGILLADAEGRLMVVGASTETIELLELFQVENDEGPCVDCFRTGQVVLHSDLDVVTLWPSFTSECARLGFTSVCAVPLSQNWQIIGCLNIFMSEHRRLTDADVDLAQALAHVATVAIIQNRATQDGAIREEHLQHALTSRIVIEQAKGIVSYASAVNMDVAFSRLRSYARHNNRGLTGVAQALVSGELTVQELGHNRRLPPPPSGR